MGDRKGTTRSGWCFAAPGARVPHRWCRSEICTCECHPRNHEEEK
jgi:hypothetical protein